MNIAATYATAEEIPDRVRELYSQGDDGSWRLTGVEGVLLTSDHRKLLSALEEAREERAATAARLKAFTSVLPEGAGPDVVKNALARVAELEDALKAANLTRQEAIDAAVKERIGPREREFEAQLNSAREALKATAAERDVAVNRIKRTVFEDVIRSSVSSVVAPTAIADVIYRAEQYGWRVTDDGDLVALKASGDRKYSLRDPTAPITFSEWVDAVLAKEAPHVFKQPTGTNDRQRPFGGAGGRPWAQLSSAERAAAIADAQAQGPEAMRALQRRLVASDSQGT